MENASTFLSEKSLNQIIIAAAEEIRTFLGFIHDPENGSHYSSMTNKTQLLAKISAEIRECASDFTQHPDKFSNQAMLEMGKGMEEAIKNFIRIEIRQADKISGAAQVVAKGVEGDFRIAAMQKLRQLEGFKKEEMTIKFAGQTSLEFNVAGVNKALPLKYLNVHLNDVLDKMGYIAGSHINSLVSKTLIAADGDGTVYGGPTVNELPTFRDSPARYSLSEYIKFGGVFVLISGNNLERSAMRLAAGLDKSLLHRCIIVGNGAASMAVFDKKGALKEIEDYRLNALNYAHEANNASKLDVIYIGDDGHENGNDLAAFEAVGFNRSFLFAYNRSGLIKTLADIYYPSQMVGVSKLIEAVIRLIHEQKGPPVFNEGNLKKLKDLVRT